VSIGPQGGETPVEKYNTFVLTHAWRNVLLHIIDGMLYMGGVSLVSRQTVLPAFIHECVKRVEGLDRWENRLVSLIPLGFGICRMLPHQILTAKLVEARRRIKALVILLTAHNRLPWFVVGVCTALLGAKHPLAALVIFLVAFCWYGLAIGLESPAWREFIAKTTPVSKRGLVFGLRGALGGALGFVALVLAMRVLRGSAVSFPTNFALLFFGMFVLGGLSVIPISLVSEASFPGERRVRPLSETLARMKETVTGDRFFRRYLLCRLLQDASLMANAVFFATKALRADVGETVDLTLKFAMVATLSRMVGAVVVGWVGNRHGFRSVIAASAFISAAGILTALFATQPVHFYIAYALSLVAFTAMMIGQMNYLLELAPTGRRPTYTTVDAMSRPLAVAAPFAGGWLADKVGYPLPFAIGAGLALAAGVLYLAVAAEPRRERPSEFVS
jgi:MFS family permease